jgi:mannose-6-phosphate isomerase-like protein (cupin superfamily)
MARALIRQDGEGDRFWFAGGGVWTMRASGDETDGAILFFEDEVVRGKTTPLHTHPHEDEGIYVLEGELLVHVDGHEHPVGERGFFFAPRGVPHAFLVTSETARLLAWQTPAGGESFYRDCSEPIASDADAERPADFDRLRAAAQRSDRLEILGPPPFAAAQQSASSRA